MPRCVGAGCCPARNIVKNRREGQSPSPTDGFTRAQTKIVSPSVKTEGFDTSLTEGGFGVPRLGARGRIATTSLRTGLAMTALASPLQKGIRSAAGQ